MKNHKELKDLLLKYSFEDLAKSLFALNVWLPNISSPVKSQYLYVLLEGVFDRLEKENQITNYEDFKKFTESLLIYMPSFPMLEDYIPEADWGEIKYFFNEKFFKIFYGGDLSNTYDFYYSFEVIHESFEDFYVQKLKRSSMKEFEFCLAIQDEIITGIDQETKLVEDIEVGDFSIPTVQFWENVSKFSEKFDPSANYETELLDEYTKDLDIDLPTKFPSENDFFSRVHSGKNCFYFFLKKHGKYFPVLPRTNFSVLFDKWGEILHENHLSTNEDIKNAEVSLNFRLFEFIQQRVKDENVFRIVSAIHTDLKPHKTVFSTAFVSKNKLILLFILPPKPQNTDQQRKLDSLVSEFEEAKRLFSNKPTRLGLRADGGMIEIRSSKEMF